MITINNRDKIDWQENMTVSDVLKKMGYCYSLITITVNGDLVTSDDFAYHLVPDNSEMTIFHLAHGG